MENNNKATPNQIPITASMIFDRIAKVLIKGEFAIAKEALQMMRDQDDSSEYREMIDKEIKYCDENLK
jgi:uncharacterized protein YehS (DUF1456 family)